MMIPGDPILRDAIENFIFQDFLTSPSAWLIKWNFCGARLEREIKCTLLKYAQQY